MRAGLAFWAGVIGAAVMVLGMWIFRMAGVTGFNFGYWWGSLVTGNTTVGSWWLGFVIHLIVGGLVGLAFAAVFEALGRSNWWLGLLGGIVSAVIGGLVVGWISLVHPAIPAVLRNPGYFTAAWGAGSVIAFWIMSLIYGAIVGGMYVPLHKEVLTPRGQVLEERHEHEEVMVPPAPEERVPEDRSHVKLGRGRRL